MSDAEFNAAEHDRVLHKLCTEVRGVISDALVTYPGDEAISLIHKILDIINAYDEVQLI